jgi:hypothetical protein
MSIKLDICSAKINNFMNKTLRSMTMIKMMILIIEKAIVSAPLTKRMTAVRALLVVVNSKRKHQSNSSNISLFCKNTSIQSKCFGMSKWITFTKISKTVLSK